MHKKSKHFEVNFHFVREKVALRKLIVHHIPGVHQLADIFTKSLPTQSFQDLRFKLGVVASPTQSLRGRVDRKDKAQMAWKQKEKTVSETSCSVSETEKKEELVEFGMGFELLKAETSFTKMGSEEPNQKPIQGEVKPTATKHQTENKERDKRSGPATYGGKQPIALQNRFQLLGSNEEVKT